MMVTEEQDKFDWMVVEFLKANIVANNNARTYGSLVQDAIKWAEETEKALKAYHHKY